MGKSLYAILGVDDTADRETIRDAFREHAKERHPDVSDEPGARRRFKRLTVARDTLLDADERARYDELGHAAYLRRHDSAELFDVEDDRAVDPEPRSDAVSAAQTLTDGAGGDGWWRERTGPEPKAAATSAGSGRFEQRRGGGTAPSWARTQASGTTAGSAGAPSSVRTVVRENGAWFVLHLCLIASAVATAIFVYTSVGSTLALPAVLFGIAVVLIAIVASSFHLVSLLYV